MQDDDAYDTLKDQRLVRRALALGVDHYATLDKWKTELGVGRSEALRFLLEHFADLSPDSLEVPRCPECECILVRLDKDCCHKCGQALDFDDDDESAVA